MPNPFSRACLLYLLVVPLAAPAAPADKPAQLTEQQIRKQIIEESIAAYPGRCPCPYNVMRNGSACGGRSAWSRQGGYAPVCYEREVTQEMVRQHQERERAGATQESS